MGNCCGMPPESPDDDGRARVGFSSVSHVAEGGIVPAQTRLAHIYGSPRVADRRYSI